jgi:hypothetical protein
VTIISVILFVFAASHRFNRTIFKKAAAGSSARNVAIGHGESPTILSQPDHPFSAVFARQQADQRFRRVFKAADDIFLHLQLPGRDP